jgi:hypothetical protein
MPLIRGEAIAWVDVNLEAELYIDELDDIDSVSGSTNPAPETVIVVVETG